MTLSAEQKKWIHAIWMGFVTGALATAQVVLVSGFTSKAALIGAVTAVVGGGLARAAGAILARITTTEPPAA